MGKNRIIKQGEEKPNPLKMNTAEKIADQLELPKDIVLGASVITMTGNREVIVENYSGIIEFREDSVLLQGKKVRIRVCGSGLTILYYTKEEMKIRGIISCVSYE